MLAHSEPFAVVANIDTVSLGYKCTEHASSGRATHVVLAK